MNSALHCQEGQGKLQKELEATERGFIYDFKGSRWPLTRSHEELTVGFLRKISLATSRDIT